ncbi:MAG: phosphotransferase [Candidatus Limnocylindrales bacterium]
MVTDDSGLRKGDQIPPAPDALDLPAGFREALARVPELARGPLTLSPLSGGITNRNFRVDVDLQTADPAEVGPRPTGAASYVVRVAGNDTHLLGISRKVEHAASVMAADLGVGPGVVAFLRPEGYLVTRFIAGRPIDDRAIHQPATLRRIGRTIRRIHEGPAIPGVFVPYRVGEAYRALAEARGVPIPAAYEPAHHAVHAVELACLRRPSPLVPCHNDLLAANFIDDGQRIRIVDWEYAGMGDPFFDLGNVSVNHELDRAEEATLLAAYDGPADEPRPDDGRLDEPPPALERSARLRLMRVVSDFREAMWAVLQQGLSSLEVDFVAYADEHFERLLRSAAEPSFAADLATVGQARGGG